MSSTPLSNALPAPSDTDMASRNFDRWTQWLEEHPEQAKRAIAADPDARRLMASLFGNSPFLSHCLLMEPDFFLDCLEQGPDQRFERLIEALGEQAGDADVAGLMKALRIAKRRVALLAGLADIGGLWDLDRVTAALTRFADLSLSLSLQKLLRQAHDAGDVILPHPEQPEIQSGVIVLGMGKLGAFELNYSSDIDIILFYDPERIDYRGRKSVQEFMIRLTRELVRMLDERNQDGYVFRTDLRLRPDPGSTPPAIAIIAAETYYEGFGQNWERAAMIKARQCAGDREIGDGFIKFLRPFIWRKHLDFAAIQDIHSIKRQINAHRGGGKIAVLGHNVKLGRGGIREIEFFAQTQQLIWGGRQPEMRTPKTLDALDALAAAEHIDDETRQELRAAYGFLRQVEHRLQMIDDQQTQTLPSDPDKLAAFSIFMGYEGADGFGSALRFHMEKVERHYAHLFEDAPPLAPTGNLVFTGDDHDPETLKTIAAMGFSDPAQIAAQIKGWHHGRARATRSARARELLTELVPSILQSLSKGSAPDAAFRHFDAFLYGMPAGVPLFSMFVANPTLLDFLAEIMTSAPRVAEMLSKRPSLLDGALSSDFFDPLPDLEHLSQELARALSQADGDFEESLDISRRWVNEKKFRVAIMTLRNLLTPAQIGQSLTNIAETAVTSVNAFVSGEFERAHGRFKGPGHALIAMGKMGGREMSASSDLDLILVYDAGEEFASSDGPKSLEAPVYYGRLAQRVINAITAKTGEGELYEVDMRLRPSGNAGPIATSFAAFDHYQKELAWTWEHMALTRARVISGEETLKAAIDDIIKKTLIRKRDPDKLAGEVHEMRERIWAAHGSEDPWEIKHRRGGLVDLEFIIQFLELRFAHEHPAILDVNAANALQKIGEAGLINPRDVEHMKETLNFHHAIIEVQRQILANGFDEKSAPLSVCALMARTAGLPSFEALKATLEDRSVEIRRIYETLIGESGRAWLALNKQEGVSK